MFCGVLARWTDCIRRYVLEKYSIPLHVDHEDGDPTNNTESNLRALCPNCHSLTSTYGALNRGRGRATRRAKDKKYRIAKLVQEDAEMAELDYAPHP